MYGQEPEYTQEQIDEALKAASDGTGVVPQDLADIVRQVRNKEQWIRYDTVIIGEGAASYDDGWFNNWADFANAASIDFFSGRSGKVGKAWTNQTTERYDYAQDIYQMSFEPIAPTGMADFDDDPLDTTFFPLLWTGDALEQMSAKVELADADTIFEGPLTQAPGGVGQAGAAMTDSAGPLVVPGTNGVPYFKNTWVWPDPVMIPAKGRLSASISLANPLKSFLTRYANCPSAKLVPMCPPDPQGATNRFPNWFGIKITFRGPRYLQLRGARST